MPTYVYTHMRIHVCMKMPTYVCINMPTYVCINMPTYVCINMPTYVYTHSLHTYTCISHTYMCISAYIHMQGVRKMSKKKKVRAHAAARKNIIIMHTCIHAQGAGGGVHAAARKIK